MAESGTCNLCSAPCASCMHFNKSVTGVKTETSGEGFCDNTSSQRSDNKSAVLNPLKKHFFDNIQDTASATCSYESMSENNETISGAKSRGRGHIPRSMTSDSNLEVANKFDRKRGEKCMEGFVSRPSDESLKLGMKAEPQTESDNNDIPEESVNVSAPRGISNDMVELPDVRETSPESHSGDESEEIVEHDVNICDICGDAGREDLLATCSGCSDGAEHTYCMQEKMEKVPEGEWFCEECRLSEKFQKQRDSSSEVVKAQPYSRLRSLNRNISLKLDSKESNADGNSAELYTPGTQSRKRQLEKVENSTGLKRQATETAKDLSAASSPHRLSRDGSFKNGAHEKVNKSLYQPSHGNTNVTCRSQTHRGSLSKSNSFNSVSLKSKGKTVDETSLKQKTQHDPTDARDGPNRLMARSMSLRPGHLVRPNAGEPKVITLSPKSFHVPEMKGFTKSKEHLSYDRKKSVKDERAASMSSSRAPGLGTSQKNGYCENDLIPERNSRDSKATQSDEKVIPLPKLTGHATRSASNIPEKKLTRHGKDESVSDSGISLCQRCKEPISSAHVCMSISPRISASDPTASKIPADDFEKMNPVKAALHAALLKKSFISKKKVPDNDRFDEQPITPNSNGHSVSQDAGSGSNYAKNASSADKKYFPKLPPHNFSHVTGDESSTDNLNHSSFLSKETMMIHTDIGCEALPNHYLSRMCTAPISAIPAHEYIWQGAFEIPRNGEKVTDLQPGFQAHLSTFASPKVMEVVQKLPPRLLLTEIPRLSAWPAQFHETGASEDNIALYFFAKDNESYEKHYKILLDKMMRRDLALTGIVNGVEVIIFPSSQLPPKSQRWNMLFFMWGVFRANKHDCHTQMARNLDASGKSSIIASDVSPSIPMPVCSVPLTDSSCNRSLSKRSPLNSYKEKHDVGIGCEVRLKPTLDGRSAVTDGPVRGNEGTLVLKSSTRDGQVQELHSVGPEGVNYVANDEKEVECVKIQRKIIKGDSDAPSHLKKELSMKDTFVNHFGSGQSNDKNSCREDLADISCLDSANIDKSQLATTGSVDVKIPCSFADTHKAGPSTSSKKIMYDLNLAASDIMDESGTADSFLSAVESSQVIAFQGADSSGWDLNSSALCADTESFPPSNCALPLFVEIGAPFKASPVRKEDTPAASLSLSLGLPFVDDKHQSSKQATTSAEQLHYGPAQAKPPFLLFGKPADK